MFVKKKIKKNILNLFLFIYLYFLIFLSLIFLALNVHFLKTKREGSFISLSFFLTLLKINEPSKILCIFC